MWNQEKAWKWYRKQPWIRGCNFVPSDCCSRLEIWQELDFEKHLETSRRELELAASIGYNSIRMFLPFEVWDQQHDGFLKRFERFVSAAAEQNISLMIGFANDCTVPKEWYRPPEMGPQYFDLGYHGGLKRSPHTGQQEKTGYSILDEPDTAERFFAMVREVISLYAHDSRILIWDLFNEPGNGNRGRVSVPHVRRIFEEARSVGPDQPLTSGKWQGNPSDELAVELSDIVSYHSYKNVEGQVEMIAELRRLKRPIINTEWLHRMMRCNVFDCFPLFFLGRIGCYNWGLVAGKTQTYEPWDSLWREYEKDPGHCDLDFTRWQHDLFRPSLRPYDPHETELIRRICALADKTGPE